MNNVLQADSSAKHAQMAICAIFFLESLVLGNWIPRIPDIKIQLELSSFALGLCLFGLSLGTMIALLTTPLVTRAAGFRRTLSVAICGWAIAMILPGWSANAIVLFITLFVAGLFIGLTEVTMNTMADAIEKFLDKRIMSRCHGFWSLGSLAGALIGAAFAHYSVAVSIHFAIVFPLIAASGMYFSRMLPDIAHTAEKTETTSQHRLQSDTKPSISWLPGLPRKSLLLLCVLPIGIMCVEGVFIDWSALFVRTELLASPMATGIIYAFFSLVMAAMRLAGDRIVDRFGAVRVAQVSAGAATIGITLFAFSPNITVAFLAAGIAGLGVANVYPLAMTAAAEREGNAADNVAAVALLSFSAFLLAPPITGWLADLAGLRIALGLFAPLAATTMLLASQLDRSSLQRQRPGTEQADS